MIVKNEAENLPRCLESVKNFVDEMVVVDTGSTDNSKAIAQRYGAKIYDFKWIDDFSAARNYGLEQASGEWILVLDADEALDEQSRLSLRSILIDSKVDAYNCILRNVLSVEPQLVYHDQVFQGWIRIFRNRPQYRFESIYHESVFPSLLRQNALIENSSFIIWHYGLLKEGVQGGEIARRERAWRYLQKAVEEDPYNGNLLFYLGNEYYTRGDLENAYQVLKRAALEVGTELAHPYETKKGLLVLSEIAFQRGEYDLAAGCAKGCLAIEGYPDLNPRAWVMLCNSFIHAIQKGLEQALAIPHQEQRNRYLAHYLQVIEEFQPEILNHCQVSSSNVEKHFLEKSLQHIQRLSTSIDQAMRLNR
jgi:glycosyltransferase involved in cell wall biosynthesis